MSARTSEQLQYQGKSIEAWLQLLGHAEASERRRAAGALLPISAGLTEVLPSLTTALKEVDPALRGQTAAAIGALGARLTAVMPMLQAALLAQGPDILSRQEYRHLGMGAHVILSEDLFPGLAAHGHELAQVGELPGELVDRAGFHRRRDCITSGPLRSEA